MKKLEEILNYTFIESKHLTISVVDLLDVVVIAAISWLLIFLFKRIVKRRVNHHKMDGGKAHALEQIFKYFVYIIAIILALDSVGVKITVLLAGSTALFVGIGLGLQDAFKDLAAGVILLTERSITVSDVVEVDNTIGEVTEIGLRTTKVRTRNDIEVIIPNQLLTSNHIVNWSHNNRKARFGVEVGVAYGSDLNLVKETLTEVAKKHSSVLQQPEPYVFFKEFGSSSLNFELLFFSNNLFRIESVKSDLRFEIDKAFREKEITIAFPQLDVWFKNPINTKTNS